MCLLSVSVSVSGSLARSLARSLFRCVFCMCACVHERGQTRTLLLLRIPNTNPETPNAKTLSAKHQTKQTMKLLLRMSAELCNSGVLYQVRVSCRSSRSSRSGVPALVLWCSFFVSSIYACTCMHARAHTHAHTHTHARVHAYTHTCADAY